ncbi:hypothetical protein NHP190003_03370 [Helicobacter sp. NHP19-003]|uniref:Uncharacterized protein n=1 Tax=Helicobacter gastrocanis TaxID=2849641 RepID=A0ABM7SG15_9HELI|nr:hypothetical protein [Helicobacter sp. NHP19-003]BCZ17055.1 hypothetical protein NHP190003_03370 [Helicobacter sp. NHP19-003]
MLSLSEKIYAIDAAIARVLEGLKDGVEISEYEVDGLRVKKCNPIDLIKELQKLKWALMARKRPKYMQFYF